MSDFVPVLAGSGGPEIFGEDQSYSDKVNALSPIAYWRINEPSGTDIDNYEGTAARDGTLSGATLAQTGIGDGETSASFDGSNDYIDIYSASLNTAFDGAEITVAGWAKVSGAGVWGDSTLRYIFSLHVNASNQFYFYKGSTSNRVTLYREGANTPTTLTHTSFSPTDWFHFALTISESADEGKVYLSGSQVGSTLTSLGAWSGSLSTTGNTLGAESTSDSATVWDGFLAHIAIWDSPLTGPQISSLATV